MKTIIGSHTRTYRASKEIWIDLTAVLVVEEHVAFAAYIGTGEDVGWVSRNGNKLSYVEACRVFPDEEFKEEDYRL